MGGLVITLTALVAVLASSYSGSDDPVGPDDRVAPTGSGETAAPSTSPSPSPSETLISLPEDMAGIPQEGAALLVELPEGFCFKGYLGSEPIKGCRSTAIDIEGAQGVVSANARLIGDTDGRMTLYLIEDGELVHSAQTVKRSKPVSVSGYY